MTRSWKAGLVALICARDCTAFVPVRPPGYSLSPAGGQALRGRQPVVAASIFDALGGEPSYRGGGGTQWLKPGAWVFVKDLNQPAQVLSVQGDGTCVLQVPTRPSPMLVKRNVRDLLLADPRTKPTTPSPPPQDADTDVDGEAAEEAQAGYRFVRDPRTGQMYVVSEPRPQLPHSTQGGKRMRIAPSKERLAGLGGPMAGGGKRPLLPGWEFVEDTFRRASEQQQQQQQPLLQQLVDAPRGGQETDDVDALRQLAKAYMLNDQPQEAASKLRQAYERDRGRFDDEALGELAEAQHREGRLTDAMKTYRQALDQNAENAKVLLMYGISLHDSGNPAAAIPYYQKAVQLDEASVATWNNLGIALQELGQFEPALQCYKRALEIDGLYSPALQNIAALTVAQGRFKMALACIQRALLLDPEDRTARRLAVEVMQRMRAGRLFPQLPSVVDRAAWKEQGVQEDDVEGRASATETVSTEQEVPTQVEEQPVLVLNDDEADDEEDADSAAAEPECAEERQAMTWNDLLEKAWTTREALQRKAAEAAATLAREEEEKLRREYEMAMERRRQAEEKIRRLYGGQSAGEDASMVAEAPSETISAKDGLVDGGRPVVSPRDMPIEVTAEAVSPSGEVIVAREPVRVERTPRLQPRKEQEDADTYPRPKAQGVPGATKASVAAAAADEFTLGGSQGVAPAAVGTPVEPMRVDGMPSVQQQQQQQQQDDVNVYPRPQAQGVPGATKASAALAAADDFLLGDSRGVGPAAVGIPGERMRVEGTALGQQQQPQQQQQQQQLQDDVNMYPRPQAQGVPGATRASVARAADEPPIGASEGVAPAAVGIPVERIRVEGMPSGPQQQQQQPQDDVNMYPRPQAQGVPGATKASAARAADKPTIGDSQGVGPAAVGIPVEQMRVEGMPSVQPQQQQQQQQQQQDDVNVYPRPQAQGVPGATKASAATAADEPTFEGSEGVAPAAVGIPVERIRIEGMPSGQQQQQPRQQPQDDVNMYPRPKAQGVPGATKASAARPAVETVSDGRESVEEQAPVELTWEELLQALARGQPAPRTEAVAPEQQVIIRPQREERPFAQTRTEAVSSREQEERPGVAAAQGRPLQDGRSMPFKLDPRPQRPDQKKDMEMGMPEGVAPQGTASRGRVAEASTITPETVSAEEDEVTLQRQQLEANLDTWEQLRRAAWTEAREKQKIQKRMKAIEEYREKLKRQRIEAAERARLDAEQAAEQARARQLQLEVEEKKALEAARLAKAVQEKALEEEKRMKAQVEEDRAAAVRRAWEEQTQAQLLEEKQARKALEERRQEAVRRAVESERMYLEQERQRRQLAEEEVRERAQAARIARQREQLETQRRWEEWRAKERERQRLQWEERERAVEERRRRVQRGLGLEAAELSDTASVAFDDAQELRSAAAPASARPVPANEIFVAKPEPQADTEPGTAVETLGIPFFITREMRRTLIEDLNYSHKEVNQMKPEVAREIIERGVKKPAKNFGRRGTTAGQSLPQSGGAPQADIDTRPTELIQQ